MSNHSHVLAWKDYRRRVRWFFLAWLGGFVVLAALGTALDLLHAPEWALLILGFFWMATFACAGFYLQRFRCPRCKEFFFFSTFSYWPFARACRHCKLPKWQD